MDFSVFGGRAEREDLDLNSSLSSRKSPRYDLATIMRMDNDRVKAKITRQRKLVSILVSSPNSLENICTAHHKHHRNSALAMSNFGSYFQILTLEMKFEPAAVSLTSGTFSRSQTVAAAAEAAAASRIFAIPAVGF